MIMEQTETPATLMATTEPTSGCKSAPIIKPNQHNQTSPLMPETTTKTSKYVRDFEAFFCPIRENELRDKARSGSLRDFQFRSLCWRYFLQCLPPDHCDWVSYCEKDREKYDKIKAKNNEAKRSGQEDDEMRTTNQIVDITKASATTEANQSADDIDDDERQYQKATILCDHKNIFKTIERDVVRTFPDMEFFRQTEIQSILENVLFNYASENPHLSYKQGMHELLAILLYVLHTDSQTCLITYEGGYANETIASLLDRKYLEHDVYHLFCALMKSIESWYQNDEIVSTNNKDNNTNNKSNQNGGSVLGVKLNMISENIVKNYDLDLFNHLEALQIAPQIYGIRWMRLLFSREFEILDLLTVWDAIICDKKPMSLTEYIFASMLVTLRRELINGDYTDCLNNLMRHQFKDVQYVIRLALHLRNPKKFPRPRPLYLGPNMDHSQSSNRYMSEANSLANKLGRQLISGMRPSRQQQQQSAVGDSAQATIRQYSSQKSSIDLDSRDSRRMPPTPRPAPSNRGSRYGQSSSSSSSSLGSRATGADRVSGQAANKFLPNINKIVSSIGQNVQDITNQMQQSSLANNYYSARLQQMNNNSRQQRSSGNNNSSHKNIITVANSNSSFRQPGSQQYLNQTGEQQQYQQQTMVARPAREYEMREMMSSRKTGGGSSSLPIGAIGINGLSNEPYNDLHSIVDYCWRLLSEQIDSLQRCLPKEKGLHSEDEIFVALAQLKKVRDVLKGSLKLEDELESPLGQGKIQ